MIGSTTYIFWLIKEWWSPSKQSKILKLTKNFIAVDKSFDLKINSNEDDEITLQTYLRNMYPELVSKTLHHQFHFVHRLDFSTSGVICIPLNKKACKEVAEAFNKKLTQKYYIAIVRGLFSVDTIEVNTPIGEDKRNPEVQKMCCDKKFYTKPKQSRSVIIVLEKGSFKNYPATKILILPITGRRHQIRAHCTHLGHTIVGDFTYSNKKDVEPNRMYLHSLRLVIPNSIEDFDVQTEDPFLHDKDWFPIKVINEFNCDIFNKFKVN